MKRIPVPPPSLKSELETLKFEEDLLPLDLYYKSKIDIINNVLGSPRYDHVSVKIRNMFCFTVMCDFIDEIDENNPNLIICKIDEFVEKIRHIYGLDLIIKCLKDLKVTSEDPHIDFMIANHTRNFNFERRKLLQGFFIGEDRLN